MNRIKQLREENKWTQAELSEKLDCAISSVGMYEKEERKPSLEVLVKLSEIFNCSIDYLLGKTDIRNTNEVNFEKELLNIGLSKKDYTPPTKEQQEKIEEFAKFVLKDNLKKKEEK